MTVSCDRVAGAKESSFVLPHDSIDSIIRMDGTWVDFSNGLIADDRSKLRDSDVIDFLSNPNHVDTQKVTIINLRECKGITDGSLAYITDHCPQLETLYAYNCNISVLPDDFGLKLKHLQALYLQNNNITTLPASIGNLAGTCTKFRIDGNPLQHPPLGVTREGIEAINRFNRASRRRYKSAKCLRCTMYFAIALVLVFFTLASISLSSAIQKQLVANSLDPAKQFSAIESSNCIIVEVVHIVNGRQKQCRTNSESERLKNCGCEDVYIYHFILTGTQQYTSIVEVEIESEIINVYQSIEHAIERGVRSCKDSDVPVDPYFHVGQETQCWRPRPSKSESESGSSTSTSSPESDYSTKQSKLPEAYNCGNDSCLKVFDPQNDVNVVYRDAKDLWMSVGIWCGAMAFMCFVSGALYFFSKV